MPGEPPAFDASVPNIARIWDYWLGGHVNFDADRAAARAVEKINPGVRDLAIRSRMFLSTAVTWAVRQGVVQLVDLGAGMPTRATVRSGDGKQARIMPVHELAREAVPHVRAAYVDSDEVAVSQAAAVLGGAGVRAVCADLRDPGAVLADPGLREVIDLARPVALILASVLHFFTAGEAREIVAGYARRVAPGSYVIISVVVSDQDMLRKVRAASGRDDLHSFAIPEIRGLLGGLELVQPGVVPARAWRGGAPDPGLRPSGPAYLMAAVGRVP